MLDMQSTPTGDLAHRVKEEVGYLFGQLTDKLRSYVVAGRIFRCRRLNGVRHEAEDGAKPEQQRETAEQKLTELDPFGNRLWRTQLVQPVAVQNLTSSLHRQTLTYQYRQLLMEMFSFW